MACILSLSAELKLDIIEHLDLSFSEAAESYIPIPPKDLQSLGQVCSVFRELCLPFLLENITLLNSAKSGAYVRSILDSANAKHVRSVHYIGIMALPEISKYGDNNVPIPPSPGDLPDSVSHVLSSLGNLPTLEWVAVQFACDSLVAKDQTNMNSSLEILEPLGTEEEVSNAERTDAHRSLMARSYRALSSNPPSSIRHLELKNVTAVACSAYTDPGFHALLQSLTSFTISLREHNTEDWCVNTMPGYVEFISKLHLHFFAHLANVRHFNFDATRDARPGLADDPDSTFLPLFEEHMPPLQTLTLEEVCIDSRLAHFITAHANTLERICLNRCYSLYDRDRMQQVSISWGELFSLICAAPVHALHMFEIGPADLEKAPPSDEGDADFWELNEADRLRQTFPGRRMWDYKIRDDKYGYLFTNDEEGFASFESGEDQGEWEKVQELVRRNNETSQFM